MDRFSIKEEINVKAKVIIVSLLIILCIPEISKAFWDSLSGRLPVRSEVGTIKAVLPQGKISNLTTLPQEDGDKDKIECSVHIVRKGDNLVEVTENNGVKLNQMREATNAFHLYQLYQQGESIAGLADKYGLTKLQVASAIAFAGNFEFNEDKQKLIKKGIVDYINNLHFFGINEILIIPPPGFCLPGYLPLILKDR